jgi:predicted nucleic acid-binding protein
VKFLLDINALLAIGHTAHSHHNLALGWIRARMKSTEAFATCAISELGFVRISVQTGLQTDVATACVALAKLKASSPVAFEFFNDDVGVDRLPAFARTPLKLTDGHLLELARANRAHLATLDRGIPGATIMS